MKIIMDMYGGDNAPLAPLKGAALAVKELGVSVLAVGNEEEMKRICDCLEQYETMVKKGQT